MKRKVFNLENAQGKKTGEFINVNPKSGGITISRDLVKILDIKKNGILFIQDEDRPQDWYIEISKDSTAFQVRAKNENNFIIQSTVIARELLTSCSLDAPARFMVSSTPIEKGLYAIITKSAKVTSRASKNG
jgi:hypothetical protein